MLTVKQAVLRRQKLAGDIIHPPFSLHALNQRFQPGRHCLHGLLNTMYRGAGGWEMPDRDTVKLTKYVSSAGWHSFGANVEVFLHRSGTVRLKCRITNSSYFAPYDYNIKIMVTAFSGKVLFMKKAGHIGTRHTENYQETMHSPIVAAFFNEFINSWLDTNTAYSDLITATVEDCLAFIGNWIIGLALIPTATVGLVVFLGAGAISLIATGSLDTGARLVAGVLWMKGPFGTFYALLAMGVARIGSNRRRLHQEEYDWANAVVFKGSLPSIHNIWLTDTIGADDRAFVWPEPDGSITLNMGPDAMADPRLYNIGKMNPSGLLRKYGEVFIHELVHAWQIEHSSRDSAFVVQALTETICSGGGAAGYRYEMPPSRPFHEYGIEQQASIVSDWYSRYFIGNKDDRYLFRHPSSGADPQQDPRWRYIAYDIQPA